MKRITMAMIVLVLILIAFCCFIIINTEIKPQNVIKAESVPGLNGEEGKYRVSGGEWVIREGNEIHNKTTLKK